MRSKSVHGSDELGDLPLLPRDDDGPVFDEPWQSQVFAVVVELLDAGELTREEWAERLGSVLREAEERGEYDTGKRYYEHWLKALERFVVEKHLTNAEELAEEGETIRENDHHRREHQISDGR